MSLLSDLRHHPRGPARWWWAEKMMTAIARARGVVSADQQLTISQTTGDLSIKLNSEITAEVFGDLPIDPFQVRAGSAPGRYNVTGGPVRFNEDPAAVTTMADREIHTISDHAMFCIQLPLQLTAAGNALTPRSWDFLDWTTHIEFFADPFFEAVPLGFGSPQILSEYVLPGGTTSAQVSIPIALLRSGLLHQWWHGIWGINIDLNQDHFTIKRIS